MPVMEEVVGGVRRGSRRVDGVWMTVAAAFAVLAAVVPDQAGRSAIFTAAAVWEILPYLLLAVAAAAYAKASGADNLIGRAFTGHVALMVVFAALMGALSPFCSCGVIPLIAALLSMGVPLPAVMAFWLASPLMDPSMFVLTAGTLGFEFAVAKALAAIAIGLMGGFGLAALAGHPLFADPLRDGVGNGGCGGRRVREPKPVAWRFWTEAPRRATFAGEALKNALFLLKWLTLAYLLESLMLAYVPPAWIERLVGGDGLGSVFLAALVGVPAYLNGYAALPLVGGFIENGMNPGAGMAFLLAGGVTSLPAAVAVFALARLPVFLAYLGFSLIGAVAGGLAWGALN